MAKDKAAKKEKPAKEKRVTIGEVATKAILAGKTNEQVIELVQEKFPESKIAGPSVNWYRTKLREDGHDVASSRKPKTDKPKAEKKAKVEKKAAKVAKKDKKAGVKKKSKKK